LGIGAELRKNASRYQATEPEVFALAMTRLPINPETFSFVDIGCGKGRTLILAHERRFNRIIGVEVSSRLARIARSNCPFAEIVEADALSWNIPAGPLVIFMFNPFGEPVMREVANRILSHKEECFVVYINPRCRNCFSSFQTLFSSEGMAIWRV
jgi:SAM-dependent methyltransferase